MSEILLGSHVSMAKPDYLVGSLNTALSYGSNTFMIYTGAPQNSMRTALSLLHIEEFQKGLKEHNIDINNLVVHAPYIVNIGTSDPRRNAISVQTLKTEVYRTHAIGCKYLVLHPGNATDCAREVAIANIANSINKINKENSGVVICLETMSGKGSEIGRTLEELATIIKGVQHKHLVGVCVDTCHINDAGYDNANIDGFLNDFDKLIDLNYLKVIHLNDSKNGRSAHKDRHENIGYGTIGFDNLLK
ncbi:putative endonuclease 4 [Bacilli bacterium]|nr:putative endonuclease 4 [Bacilli bacterium]